jgi:hypothetical protein
MRKNLLTALAVGLALGVSSSVSHAESYPVWDIEVNQQSMGENGFTYPEMTHLESEAVVHDVLFFYTQDMVDYFEGDLESLVSYAEDAVEINNEAFRRQDIPLRRKIVGIIEFPEDSGYSDEDDGSLRLQKLSATFNKEENRFSDFFNASYVVAFNRYYPEIASPIGLAYLGGKYSWISPYRNQPASRTLAHELAHNDGFAHNEESYQEYSDYTKQHSVYAEYAAGAPCGDFASIMSPASLSRAENFFSSPLVTDEDGVECGTDNVADSARAYREAAKDEALNMTGTFDNNMPTKEATGTVSLSVISNEVQEGEPVEIEVLWNGAEYGDTVMVIARQGTAGIDRFQTSLLPAIYEENVPSTLTIETFDNDTFELDETFTLELVYPNGVSIDSGAAVQEIVLTSDEIGDPGVVSFTEASASVSEGQTHTLTLNRTGGTDGEYAMTVSAIAGTADESDYSALSEVVTFAHGESTKTVSLSITNDIIEEPLETFSVTLSGDVSFLLGDITEQTISIAASDVPAPVSSGSGGGGSMGIIASVSLMLLAVRRRFSLTKRK